MSQPTALPLFISDLGTKRRLSTGWNKVIRIAPGLTSAITELIRCSIHCAAIRASMRSPKRLFRRAISVRLRNEDRQLLGRAEAAQCLQGRGRVRGRRLAFGPGRDSSLSALRNPDVGDSPRRLADCDR